MLDRALGKDRSPDAVSRLSPRSKDDIIGVILDLKTPSFLTSKRFVILNNCDVQVAAADDELARALEDGLPCGYLVLNLDKLNGRSKLAKLAKKKQAAVDCRSLWDTPPPWQRNSAPYQTELHQWTVRHAGRLGLKMTPPLAGELIALTGNSPGNIDQELKKLKNRLPPSEKIPNSAQIQALVPDNRKDTVFELVDRTLSGQLPKAAGILGRLFRMGYALPKELVLDGGTIAILTVGAFTSRLKTLRQCRYLLSQRETMDDLVSAGIVRKIQLPSVNAQLKRLNAEAIDQALRLLLKADRRLKGRAGPVSPQTVMEQLVVRLGLLGGA